MTVSRIRGIQTLFKLPLTGILDKATFEQVNKLRWMEHAL